MNNHSQASPNSSRIVVLALFFFCLPTLTSAELVDNGDGTISDTNTCLMWIQDANYAGTSGAGVGGMPYDMAAQWVDNLMYAGHDNWRLPSAQGAGCIGGNCFDSELAWLYQMSLRNYGTFGNNFDPFVNVPPNLWHWMSPKVPPSPPSTCPEAAWYYTFHGIALQGQTCTGQRLAAWPVRNIPNCSRPQCRDGVDNDDDGYVDYPADPDCVNSDDNSERPSICWTHFTGRVLCLDLRRVIFFAGLAVSGLGIGIWLLYRRKKT